MAKKSSFQIKAEYAAVRALFVALGLLPRRLCLALCFVFLRIGFYLIGGLRRTGMRNLEIAFPEMPVAERREILKGTFDNLGRVLGEMTQFHKSTSESLARIIDLKLDETAQGVYDRHEAEGRGVMMVTGHFGNWELLVMAFAAVHEPISYLARPLDNPLIDEMTAKIRSRFGNVPIDKNNSAMMAIRILTGGGGLGILADVNVHPKEGIFVPFFGVPACTSIGPAMIAAVARSINRPCSTTPAISFNASPSFAGSEMRSACASSTKPRAASRSSTARAGSRPSSTPRRSPTLRTRRFS